MMSFSLPQPKTEQDIIEILHNNLPQPIFEEIAEHTSETRRITLPSGISFDVYRGMLHDFFYGPFNIEAFFAKHDVPIELFRCNLANFPNCDPRGRWNCVRFHDLTLVCKIHAKEKLVYIGNKALCKVTPKVLVVYINGEAVTENLVNTTPKNLDLKNLDVAFAFRDGDFLFSANSQVKFSQGYNPIRIGGPTFVFMDALSGIHTFESIGVKRHHDAIEMVRRSVMLRIFC